MAALFTVYSDVTDVLSNALLSGETASLIGLNTQLAVTESIGATSLQVFSTSGGPSVGTSFQCWILDGPSSEYVTAQVTDATHLSVPAGTQAAHAAGVSVSSGGTSGCLASVIKDASALIEQICKQGPDGGDRSLYRVARTEILSGPNSWRAVFDADATLLLRPYHFPVTAVASVSVQMGAQTAAAIDLSYLVLPDAARLIRVPYAQIVGTWPNNGTYYGPFWPRDMSFFATLAYTGGPCGGTTLDTVPAAIREACYLLIMDRLAFRQNPYGAAQVRRGDFMIETRLRGDTSGKSLLRMQAESYLADYMADC